MDQLTHILHVDDDEIDVINVKRAFTKSQSRNPLFHAEDGRVALEMLRDGSVPKERRLVLLDVNMPRMNGIEFLRALRDDTELRHTPVVILTSSEEAKDRSAAYQLHVAGYHVKPTKFGALVALLSTLDHYWSLAEMR